MNFFERQAAARSTSFRLVILMVLAVAGTVGLFALVTWAIWHSWRAMAFTTGVTLVVIVFGSLYRMTSLAGGGAVVARQMGGIQVPEDTVDPSLRRLRNVVEEMAIAAGMPVPAVFVLEYELGINAFAAGHGAADAAIAVTRGALDCLNRDELQGVIAHEFSHILNGDIRLNLRLIGVVFGIMMIGTIGRKLLLHGGSSYGWRGIGVLWVIGGLTVMVGGVGLFFGRLIRAGISRSRERLADASAVQFTRQTAGLAGALKKIAGVGDGSRFSLSDDAEEVSHMLFGDGVGFSGMFATHPPLLERIRALEPGFSDARLRVLQEKWCDAPPDGMQEDVMLGLQGSSDALPASEQQYSVTPPMVAGHVATPIAEDCQRADAIVAAIPEALGDLARGRESAMPLLLALLLGHDEHVQEIQCKDIAARLGKAVAEHALRIHQQLTADLHPALRLPLAALAFPALRLRPRPQLDAFLDAVHAVVHADARVSLFEYCLGKLLDVQVREALDPGRHARFGRRKLGSVRHEVATLLAVVAQYGHADASAAARYAYAAGLQRVLPQEQLPYAPPAAGVLALDPVWDALDALDPLAKQLMVEAITAAISHDGRVTVAEAELLRTLCAVLHCPLPPVLGK